MRWSPPEPVADPLRPRLDHRRGAVDPLPAWMPPTLRGGWTPDGARAAAATYAAEVAPLIGHPIDPVARAAHHALLGAFPGLRGADIVDRLRCARDVADEPELDEAQAPF